MMTPRFSVFTPTHRPEFLPSAYESLCKQEGDAWEWLVLPNHGCSVPQNIRDDKRVRVLPESNSDFVGALKREACRAAGGQILVELDHDDLLMDGALHEVGKAFDDPKVGFVYSDAARCNFEFEKVNRFGEGFGWQYQSVNYNGHEMEAPISFAPRPESVSRIWYAPDHVRAFRRDVYESVGGHNSGMRVLDDQDLMSRMYCETEFKHIEKPLYVYRIHGMNSWIMHNQEIQENVYRLYDKYIEAMAIAWAKRSGLRALELGGRMAARPWFETVDLKDADICCDLNKRWLFADSTVGVVRACDVFEHLPNSIHTMKELHRVLAPGGIAFIQVPSTDGRGAFQDPTHKSFWNENSWLYYTNSNWAKYIDTPVRFQAIRTFTTPKNDMQVCWTNAHLVCLKGGYRPPGIIAI